MTTPTPPPPRRLAIVAALLAVYVIWGSTYLAIHWVLGSLPPFSAAGIRFIVSGLALLAFALARKTALPPAKEWFWAAVVGLLLFLGGNGGVMWATQTVPSGLVALLVCTVPLWMVMMDSFRPQGPKLHLGEISGVVLGLLGVALLVGPERLAGVERVDPHGALVVICGSMCWSLGSIVSRQVSLPKVLTMAAGVEMLCGGLGMLAVGGAIGEFARIDPAAVSTRSWWSLLYLIVFGSLVALSCYLWLLRVTRPAVVASYAYANPVVAVALGAWLGGEPFTARTAIAASVILAGVVMLTVSRQIPHLTQRWLRRR